MAESVIYKTFVYSSFRFEVEIVSTGEVKEYSASANYDLQREGTDLVDTLKFAVQAEGKSLKKKCGLALLWSICHWTGKKIFMNKMQ